MFGEGAEDAVSIEGGVSDGDQYSQEEDLAASVSIVEEAYMVSDAFESRHEPPSKIISEPESQIEADGVKLSQLDSQSMAISMVQSEADSKPEVEKEEIDVKDEVQDPPK